MDAGQPSGATPSTSKSSSEVASGSKSSSEAQSAGPANAPATLALKPSVLEVASGSKSSTEASTGVGQGHANNPSRANSPALTDYVDSEEGDEFQVVGHANKQRQKKKEENRKAQAAEHSKLMLALWPTAEQIKNFREKAGIDPEPGLLLRNLRFRDRWSEFQRSARPSAKERTALRRMAIDITRTDVNKKKANTSKSANNDNNRGNKRKNRSSSLISERGAPMAPKASTPLPKIPKLNSGGYNKPPPPTKELEVVEDSEDEPEIDLADLDDALPSHAEVASGKKAGKVDKQDYPFILYIHTGSDERRKINRETWKILYEKLEEAVFQQVLEDKQAPKIDWHAFKAGVGIIAPKDETSQGIVKDMVANIMVDGSNFRAWSRGERGKYTPVTVKIPATMPQDKISSGKLLQVLIKQNGLPDNKAEIRSCNPVSQGSKERLLRIAIEEELHQAIINLDGYLYLGASRVEVHLGGTKITKVTNNS